MTDGLVIRLLRVASYMNDIGENGYEVETIKEAAVRIDAMLASLHEISVRFEQLEAALDELLTYQVASEAAARNIGELTKIMQKHRVLLREKYDK